MRHDLVVHKYNSSVLAILYGIDENSATISIDVNDTTSLHYFLHLIEHNGDIYLNDVEKERITLAYANPPQSVVIHAKLTDSSRHKNLLVDCRMLVTARPTTNDYKFPSIDSNGNKVMPITDSYLMPIVVTEHYECYDITTYQSMSLHTLNSVLYEISGKKAIDISKRTKNLTLLGCNSELSVFKDGIVVFVVQEEADTEKLWDFIAEPGYKFSKDIKLIITKKVPSVVLTSYINDTTQLGLCTKLVIFVLNYYSMLKYYFVKVKQSLRHFVNG